MAGLDAVFGSEADFNAGAEVPAAAADVASDRKAKKKELDEKIKEIVRDELAAQPGLVEILNTKSQDMEVVSVMATYIRANIKVDKSNPNAPQNVRTSYKIGYKVKNVGTEPVQYMASNYVLDAATGQYVDQPYTATVAPGEEFIVDRKRMTELFSRPEYSFTLRNGHLQRSSAGNLTSKDEILASYYFTFDAESGMYVNDDSMNTLIDKEGPDGTPVVDDKYLPYFGFLMNAKAPKERKKGAKKAKITAQQANALYIRHLLETQGE